MTGYHTRTAVEGAGPIRNQITVYTSNNCAFCQEATRLVKEAATRTMLEPSVIEVVETKIEDDIELFQDLGITAVPTILIGKARITGLPCVEDVENLIHEMTLVGFNGGKRE